MDLRLPGMDGMRGVVALHGVCPELGFVTHTGSPSPALPVEVRAIGVEDRQLRREPRAEMGLLAAMGREPAPG